MPSPIPPFSDLPLDKSGPHHNAWGLYGPTDELGTLNRLTPPIIASAAASEIRTGIRINLDRPLDARPFFGRQAFSHHGYQKPPRIVNDDVWTLNPQSSSQWDGLRHYAYQREGKFYNGVTLDDIHGTETATATGAADERGGKSNVLGVGAWAAKGGIVGRGVLLDYHEWRLKHGIEHNAFARDAISVETLKRVAEEQGTEIKFGDILLIRTGYLDALSKLSGEELEVMRHRQPLAFTGVEQSEEMLEFLWSNFSAAGGDQPAFEVWLSPKDWTLHEVMLSGWGMPIGELLDLEELGKHCKDIGKWSFFVVSKPNYVPGGMATPANMVAIF